MQLYDEDLGAWAREQAHHLRAGRFDLLDLEHLAEEIEAARETGSEIQRFPAACPWTVDQVLGEGWLPE